MIKNGLNFLISSFNALNLYVVLPLLVVIILADILLRTLISTPIVWAHEVSGCLLICLFFLAIPSCVQQRQLLDVDIVYRLLNKRLKRCLNHLTTVLLLGFSGLMTVQGYLGLIDSLEYQARASSINIPYWPFYGLMTFVGLVCSLQLTLAFFVSFVKHAPSEPI